MIQAFCLLESHNSTLSTTTQQKVERDHKPIFQPQDVDLQIWRLLFQVSGEATAQKNLGSDHVQQQRVFCLCAKNKVNQNKAAHDLYGSCICNNIVRSCPIRYKQSSDQRYHPVLYFSPKFLGLAIFVARRCFYPSDGVLRASINTAESMDLGKIQGRLYFSERFLLEDISSI